MPIQCGCNSRSARYFMNNKGCRQMMALILGLGIPAAIAMAVASVLGAVKLTVWLLEKLVACAQHEMLMRPKNVYFRWECR